MNESLCFFCLRLAISDERERFHTIAHSFIAQPASQPASRAYNVKWDEEKNWFKFFRFCFAFDWIENSYDDDIAIAHALRQKAKFPLSEKPIETIFNIGICIIINNNKFQNIQIIINVSDATRQSPALGGFKSYCSNPNRNSHCPAPVGHHREMAII